MTPDVRLRAAIAPSSSLLRASTQWGRVKISFLASALLLMFIAPAAMAQAAPGPGQVGKWQILTNKVPINPVHASVMHNGKVLMIEGKNTSPSPLGAIWDPATQTATTFPLTYTMFCDAMVVLPDGRPFVMGGTLSFKPFTGQDKSSAYDLTTGVFHDQASMADGRWYPTGTVLDDGKVMVFSGQDEGPGDTNNTVEIFTANSGIGSWSAPVSSQPFVPPLYPRLHLLPDGRIFYSGSGITSEFYDLTTQKWTVCCTTNFKSDRFYGTSVLLPLSPATGYKPQVMILGGDATATATTEIIDLSASNPQWAFGPPMSEARVQLNATILPSGNVLVTGGSAMNEDATTASFNADLYNPKTNSFTSAGMNSVPRLYHSNAILLPDATVILTGSNPPNVPYENRVELYQPAYLFNPDGTKAKRPLITSVIGGAIAYNSTFQIQTPDAASIASVVVIRPAGVTHAFNMEQRLVELSVTVANAASGTLTVVAPPSGKIAPPGYYLLFIVNTSGVPSVGQFVQFCPSTGCL